MTDLFRIEGPAVVSFSGGRTSSYMLWRILQAHGGKLPDDVLVIFQNTGKEERATLDFIRKCEIEWKVRMTWLEFNGFVEGGRSKVYYRVVDWDSASRDGEPYEKLIEALKMLPNPVARTCTSYLKVKTMISYLHAGGWAEWDTALGIRADEPRRVARLRAPGRDERGGHALIPLADAGVSAADVGAFWASQTFDLKLPNNGGKTMHGNCDLCFLKGPNQILSLIRERPERALWWIKQEEKIVKAGDGAHAKFRNDRPSYRQMYEMATRHQELFAFEIEDTLTDCMCTD